jgi:hypothetical protein
MSMESTGGGQSVGYDLAGASVGAFFSCHVKVHVPRRPGSTDSGLFSLSGIIGKAVVRTVWPCFLALSLVERT